MTSELFRWQAAMGAVAGALIADARASDTPQWGADAMRSLDIAEAFLGGTPIPVDLAPHLAVPAAVGLASAPAPMLANTTTVALIDAIRHGLHNRDHVGASDPTISRAARLAHGRGFREAIETTDDDRELAALVGAFIGFEGGLGAVPARDVSTFCAPDGSRGRRYLRGLTNRLLGLELPNWYDPRRRRGPKEVLPGLWLSNLYGIAPFTETHPNGLVLSLCDEEGRLAGHKQHITFHIEDTPRADANPSLQLVLDEVVAEISSARAEERPVLVHCRHGASRTGLVLRLLLVSELGISADEALIEAECLWPHTSSWNEDWTREVRRRAHKP